MGKLFYTLDDLRNWEAVTAAEPVPLRLAVIGDPVAHSRSPQMHNPALEKVGINMRYARLHILPNELEEAFHLLPKKGFIGVNVTIPHKARALELVDTPDAHAQKMGAVNTVLIENGKLLGYSTDGPGFVRAIRESFSLDVRDLRVMVLGAGGGAGRSIAVECALENCERLVLVNRTHTKSEALAKELQPLFETERLLGAMDRLITLPWEETALRNALLETDLVVNATSLGMKRSDPVLLPPGVLQAYHVVYDTVYAGSETPFLREAARVGARGANGLSMLLHQGALAFEIWFNRDAPLETMRRGLTSEA